MPHRILQVPEHGMLDSYLQLLASRGYEADAAQRAAADRLQRLYAELLGFKARRRSGLRKLLNASLKVPRGVYFWGGVGRGKSFLMDCFFDSVPYKRKKRIHFHAFMQQIHRDLKELKGEADPLATVAKRIANEARVLCFDEFHVSDIADAMILGRLLEALFLRGTVVVMTSNYPPDKLYPNGLQRQNFLSTIELLKRQLDVIEVEAGIDYRLRALTQVEIYHSPLDDVAEAKMADYFRELAGEEGETGGELMVLDRLIALRRRSGGVVWFDFDALCGGPRSQNDYLELARGFHTVLLSGIPQMSAAQSNEARRFTWMVDVFYDARVKLICTAATAPDELYRQGTHSSEFFRTVSRLTEMQSAEYLALPHLVPEG
jgi:cell division protein ZapE